MGQERTVLVVEPDEKRREELSTLVREGGLLATEIADVDGAARLLVAGGSAGSDPDPDRSASARSASAHSAAVVLAGDLGPEAIERLAGSTAATVPVVCRPSDGSSVLASDLLGAGAVDYVDASAGPVELADRLRRAARRTAERTDGRDDAATVLDRVFETSPVGLFVYDDALDVLRLNERALELLDATDRSSFDERMKDESRMRDLVDENGDELSRDDLPSAVVERTEEPVFGRIIGARTGEGTQWMIINAAPVFRDGELSRIVVAVDDITEQRRRAAELERQNRRLEGFGAVVSHDLRNPLAVATGYLELARNAETEPERRDALDRVANAHERMGELISGLRTLARRGDIIGETTAVTLESVAKRAWETVDVGDVELVVEADADVDVDRPILADPDRLRQLFENLFRNVHDHAPTATTVIVRIGDGEFAVSDDGEGFGAIDDPFAAGVTGGDGTGLGLAIVSEVADGHGWTVHAASDGGARFRFTGVEQPR